MLALLAVLELGPVQPGAAQTADPRVGSWSLISAQSSLDPPNKLSVTPSHSAIHVVMTGETHLDFTAKSDGQDTPVPANPGFNQVDLRRIDKRQSEVQEKKNGALVATVRVKASKDDNELIASTVISGRADQVAVWTRTGGAKVANDPLAGEWTQDLSKTRLQQGLVLKIEPDGSGAFRFSWEYSYTARLDGRPYDLKNSRNDTVALQLVDAHTVDATYRRDNQVTQKDRWAVSADGQQMTMTTTGTLETGQHLSEKLVFKRQ